MRSFFQHPKVSSIGIDEFRNASFRAKSRNRYPFPHHFGPIPPLRLGKVFFLSKVLSLGFGRNDRRPYSVYLNRKCSDEQRCRAGSLAPDGFTLIEVLVTLAMLLVILIAVLQFMTDIDRAWKSAATDPFAEAQDAFSAVAQNLAAATLDPYEDYADSGGAFRTGATFVPDHLARRSDLDFVCGPSAGAGGLLTASGRTTAGDGVFFLAPQGYTQTYAHEGMERLLNAMGYFVEFGDDGSAPAFILPGVHDWRWRLKQVRQPAESLQIFALATSSAWIEQAVQAPTPVLAQNVVALIVLPERAAGDSGTPPASDFRYDSRDTGHALTLHQLPPRVRVALVAVDEPSAQLLAGRYGSNPPPLVPGGLFQRAAQLDADLASLDSGLTAQKIGHRIFQREILLPAAAWSNAAAP